MMKHTHLLRDFIQKGVAKVLMVVGKNEKDAILHHSVHSGTSKVISIRQLEEFPVQIKLEILNNDYKKFKPEYSVLVSNETI